MRNVILVSVITPISAMLVLAFCACASAQVSGGGQASPGRTISSGTFAGAMPVSNSFFDDKQARLDRLFDELRRSGDESVARRISQRIRSEWAQSGSATIDLIMHAANAAVREKRYDAALDHLDEIVTLLPAYAEGWNLRATVHFARDDYARAMADIDQVLRLEPRHFGALAGMAAILGDTGHEVAAARVYERLLELYPMMRSAQSELGRLADDIAGQGI